KASYCHEKWEQYEPDRLRSKQRSVRFRAVREIGAGQSVTNPKERGYTEVKYIEWTRFRIRIPIGQPENDGREPKRTEHPEPIPEWSAHPRRRPFPHPWGCRCDLNYGGG